MTVLTITIKYFCMGKEIVLRIYSFICQIRLTLTSALRKLKQPIDMKLDLNFVRSQFPAFKEPSLEGWAFFENAGGSYPCIQVVNRLTDFYTKNKVQVNYPY